MCGLFAKINDTNRDKDRGGYGLARIAGVDLPRKKRIEIGMTYILGEKKSEKSAEKFEKD